MIDSIRAFFEAAEFENIDEMLFRFTPANAQKLGRAVAERTKEIVSQRDRLRDEMRRYLPIIERCEMLPALWDHCTQGTGVATANGYRAALQEEEG